MKVFAHGIHHEYLPTGFRGSIYFIPANGWEDLPDEVGRLLIAAHPNKLCDVSLENEPAGHSCQLSRREPVATTMLPEPPVDTMVKPRLSAQKLRQQKEAMKRSIAARREVRG